MHNLQENQHTIFQERSRTAFTVWYFVFLQETAKLMSLIQHNTNRKISNLFRSLLQQPASLNGSLLVLTTNKTRSLVTDSHRTRTAMQYRTDVRWFCIKTLPKSASHCFRNWRFSLVSFCNTTSFARCVKRADNDTQKAREAPPILLTWM